ncbi:MAG: hypothetical protein JWM46_56 [Candidatus Kaiserbacteria bacterium]|nr:hypothetical protein [Candidatus Kaiserbacteria bacterium]
MIASAHEVYVLPPDLIAHDLTMPGLQVLDILHDHTASFFFWMFITIWAILTVLSISVSKPVERYLSPVLRPLKRYAPLVARLTLGIAIFASGYFGALFGPELPFTSFVAAGIVPTLEILMMALGALITIGLFTRAASALLIIVFAASLPHYGSYMFTYANYLGEMFITLTLGNASFAIDRYFHHRYPHVFHTLLLWCEERAFVILRVSFGISLIFASVYAKYIHAQLALDTVTRYGLDTVFPFQAPFIVLGAFAIEVLLGLFFLFGIEIRFASLFLLFWLSLSLLYFGEAVWPHIILAGVAIAIFMHGYDRYTIELRYLRRSGKRATEPVF